MPIATTATLATSVQSYGFTIMVPDGVGFAITSSLGGAAGSSTFNGDQVGGSVTEDGYLVTETLGAPTGIGAPDATPNAALVTIQLSNILAPDTLRLLPNNSTKAGVFPSLESFLSADTENDGMAVFSNAIINSATGISGTSSIMFSTLSTTTAELEAILLIHF